MIKNFKMMLALVALLVSGILKVSADEGMWIPMLLKNYNYEDMKAKGLKLTPEQLYDINNSSLKDAIVWFNGGCTGEIISSSGLILTNHHCGYDAIAGKSTPEDNILDNGFWAKNNAEEKPIEGMWISIVQSIEDVTDKVLPQLAGVEEKARQGKLREIYKTLIDEAKAAGKGNDVQVREMFKGNAYYLFIFKKYDDIRLVGTPPQSIGKFGGDTDNWMWPRHTGDFSMFRVYAGKNNEPSAYAAENKPLSPKHFLPVSLKGVKEGDYAMIMGFPGRTNRYEFSNGVQVATDMVDPAIVALRAIRLNAWKEQMNKDVDVRLKMSSEYAMVANYWKYFQGQAEQLKKNRVFEKKQSEEKAFAKWAAGKDEYKNVLPEVEKAFNDYKPYSLQRTYLNEGLLASNVAKFAAVAMSLEKALEAGNIDQVSAMKENLLAFVDETPYMPAMVEADKRVFDSILVLYYTNIPKDQQAPFMNEIISKYNKDNPREAFKAYTNDMFSTSIFADGEMVKAFFGNPRLGTLKNDMAYTFVKNFRDHYINTFKPIVDVFTERTNELGRKYIKGLMEMNPKRKFYPDANSSIRLTYGSAVSYLKYPLITNLDEAIEKGNKYKGNPEFDVPQKLIDLHKAKDYGQYAMKNGKLPLCFLTNNDITGGNSGSPVIDGDGNLIGTAFDGNWEAMSGDIAFEPKLQRTISVDIRYTLFIIDKFAGATNLINEMKIVK